jgi:hypothetical protein
MEKNEKVQFGCITAKFNLACETRVVHIQNKNVSQKKLKRFTLKT